MVRLFFLKIVVSSQNHQFWSRRLGIDGNHATHTRLLPSIFWIVNMLKQMGSMGVYAGLIYNDYFSLGLDLFGSNYTFKSHESGAKVYNYYVYATDAVR